MCFRIGYFVSPHYNAELDTTSHSDEGTAAQQAQTACKGPQLFDAESEFEPRSVCLHSIPKVMFMVTKTKTHKIWQGKCLIQCPYFIEEEVIQKYENYISIYFIEV